MLNGPSISPKHSPCGLSPGDVRSRGCYPPTVTGCAVPGHPKQSQSIPAAVPAGEAADRRFPSTYATHRQAAVDGRAQTSPHSPDSAHGAALADTAKRGELWTAVPWSGGRTGTFSVRGWRPAPSPRYLPGRRAGAPAMPRRRRPGRAEAGVRPRALLPALLGRARRRTSPRFVGGSGIRPVDCRSGGCGFESRPPRSQKSRVSRDFWCFWCRAFSSDAPSEGRNAS